MINQGMWNQRVKRGLCPFPNCKGCIGATSLISRFNQLVCDKCKVVVFVWGRI